MLAYVACDALGCGNDLLGRAFAVLHRGLGRTTDMDFHWGSAGVAKGGRYAVAECGMHRVERGLLDVSREYLDKRVDLGADFGIEDGSYHRCRGEVPRDRAISLQEPLWGLGNRPRDTLGDRF
jgi:hypothetical protein